MAVTDYLPSPRVMARPQLLEHFIRSQFVDCLRDETRDDYSKAQRKAAIFCIQHLSRVRHECAADIMRDILS